MTDPLIFNPALITYKKGKYAGLVTQALNRANWDDWKTRFKPVIEQAAGIAQSSTFAGEQGQRAADATRNAFGLTGGALTRQRQGFGLNLDPAQQQAEQRKLALGQSAAALGAYNSTANAARDMQDQLLAGGYGLKNIPY